MISDKGAKHIAELLHVNESLTILFLHWNKIGSLGFIEITESLMGNESLLVLDLSFNCLTTIQHTFEEKPKIKKPVEPVEK
jgi:hypothetical protein